jgi:hypothetical protein
MNYKQIPLKAILLFSIVFIVASCSQDDNEATPVLPLEAVTVIDLPANPSQNIDGSARVASNQFTLFNLKDNAIVPNADSISTKWDIGFRGTTIIVNGGISGPGQTSALVVNGIFEELKQAPAEGYVTDAQGALALPGSAWYTYTAAATAGPQHAIIPIPGKILVVKTSSGNYAKIEMLSYYAGNPDTSTPSFANLATRPAAKYYTFRYSYQPTNNTQLD